MSKGTIVEEGTHDSLIEKKGHYFDLVTAQRQAFNENDKNEKEEIEEDSKDIYDAFDRKDSTVPSKTDVRVKCAARITFG